MPNNKKKTYPSTDKKEIKNEFNSYASSYSNPNSGMGFSMSDFFTQDQLAKLAKDPMGNNERLRELSLTLYGTNGVYTNTVDYMTAMPTLDRVIVAKGDAEKKKKANKEKMEAVLKLIKDKEIVRDALFKGMLEGIAFYYFETAELPEPKKNRIEDKNIDSSYEINSDSVNIGNINVSIISLPANYTKIVGIKNSSYVIAFNLKYFDEENDEEAKKRKLLKYPKEIRDAYGKNSKDGEWLVLDNKKTIVHKIRSKREERYGRPLVLAAIADILYNDYFIQTKRNVLDEINNKIIYETFPEGEKKGSSALTKKQQENQHTVVKQAVLNKNNKGGTSFFSVAAGTKLASLNASNTDIFDDKYESNLTDKISLDMGFAGALLNGVGSGSYSSQNLNLELISSELFQWIEQIAEELNKCINFNIIKDAKNSVECRYLPITHVNKKEMVGFAKDLYLQGKGSLSLWASAVGISPEIFFSLLDQEKEADIENKYPVHKTSYTLSASDKKAGRPETDEPTEGTIASRANDGNSLPSPSD